MSRVVSLTPAALARDSRTLKEATTIARLGHESVVVEAQGSGRAFADAPFRLLTLRSVGESLADEAGSAPTVGRGGVLRIAQLLGRLFGPLYFLASWVAFNVTTARRLPAADLYWLHGYEQALAVWLRRTPYVYDAHDLYAALPFDGRRLRLGERLTHRLRERIERRCIARAAVRVTTSAAMARAYERRFGHPFRVIRNAQDTRLAQPSPKTVRAAAGAGPDDFLLAMVAQRKPGTIVPAELPDGVRLAFVGDGYAGDPPPGVAFVGSVPPEQIGAFLADADAAALLYVPVTENSPTQLVNGLFHAVAAGLPLLYPARMDAIREVCEEHGLGVAVEPEDPASLAAGIAALRAGLDRYRAAVAAAAPQLSWEREEAAVADALTAGLAAGRGG
ncbi:MAG: glycosyltransferase [Solirubrobacteraceae bacterium]|nr:glycosyltransferase [Solirubrobacteraceae bacterium]